MFQNYSEKFEAKKLIGIFLLMSVFSHLAFIFSTFNFSLTSTYKPDNKAEVQKLLVKLMSSKSAKTQQIARSEENNKKSDKPKFLSRKNNSFERETKSAKVDSFKSAKKGIRTAQNDVNQTVNKKVKKSKNKKISLSDLGVRANKKAKIIKKKKISRKVASIKGLENGRKDGRGLGQTNDFLEDVPLGDFTKLNTQEYQFFGFYDRVRKKLEQFWGFRIQEQAKKIFKSGRHIASEKNLVTGLTIELNDKGEIVDIMLKSTSGMRELDQAAIDSFNQAGPFPNPPKKMLKNGRATIEWGFVVNT